jgi:uncharacterized protein YbjT (DUF2867 family)
VIIHVTGASGFLGAHVVAQLIARGHAVNALARSETAAARVAELGATPVPGDLDDAASLDEAFAASGAEALVNLASLGFGHAPNIVAAAEEAGLKRAVFVSTTAIFTTLNAGSKQVRLTAEDTIRTSALDWTIVRPTMIYGTAADRNMARLLQLVRRSPVVPLPGGGHRLQQPVHVNDLACAIVAAVESPLAVGQAYDLAGPEPLTLRQVLSEAATAVGRSPRMVAIPLAPAVAVVKLYERVAPRPRVTAEQLQRLGEDKTFDISAARRDLAFAPRSFATGIAEQARMRP